MVTRALTVVTLALPLAALDLLHKSVADTPPWGYHERSAGWIALSLGVLAGCLLLARVPSFAVAIGAGVTAGGVAGNVGSALSSSRGVPNPLVVETAAHLVAFNLADVFTVLGIALLLGALVLETIRHRARLPPARTLARELRRRLSR
jgi:hypothetical protein